MYSFAALTIFLINSNATLLLVTEDDAAANVVAIARDSLTIASCDN